MRTSVLVMLLAGALAVAGCANLPPDSPDAAGPTSAPPPADLVAPAPSPGSVLRATPIDQALGNRILALDPDHLSEADVREVLAAAPAPRIVLIHGGVPGVYLLMVSFGRFLVGMGYPEAKIRDPRDRDWSRSPFEDGRNVAGLVAWYYEHDGVRPMLVGHSQGGVQAVKILRALNGAYGDQVAVWDPLRDAPLTRTSIVDPLTGRERPVVGITLPWAASVGAGGFMLANPSHWDMIGRVYTIPDSVEDFTGYSIAFDPIAWTGGSADEYRHNGTANVRNVILPAGYSHVFVPLTHELAGDPRTRDWINAYVPASSGVPDAPPDLGQNVLWAADVWYSVKKHWCLEAQRLVRAEREHRERPLTNAVK